MDILNTVFSALNLLATVIIGVINVTWMISRDVFRDSLGQSTILKNDKKNDALQSTKLKRSLFLNFRDRGGS